MFEVGEIVSYGLHGRCQVISIDEINHGSEVIKFYNLQTTKTIGAKNQGVEAKVLVPVDSAIEKGLRHPIKSEEEIERLVGILKSGDTFFDYEEHWKREQKKIDDLVRDEGAAGLAKAIGHLYTAQEMNEIPISSDAVKYLRLTKRILSREFADAVGDKSTRNAEKMINKALKERMEEIHLQSEVENS